MSTKITTRVRNAGNSGNKLSKIIIKQEQDVHTDYLINLTKY